MVLMHEPDAVAEGVSGAGGEMVQLLTPEGRRRVDPRFPLDIADAQIVDLYRDMVIARRLDTEAIALQRQGEMGLWTSMLGQEAAQIGSARALAAHDMVFPSYREHGVALCRGVAPTALVGVWRGSEAGGWDPHAHNFAPYTIVIGAQTLHAAGYAMGVVRDGAVGTGDTTRDTAVAVYFGDGAMSQGDVSEAFVWAAAQQLPVVFLCQNNQWAISAPSSVQSRTPLHRRAEGFGFPGVQVDGNDVLACLAVTRSALERARSGNGPTLVEAYTYRMNPHTTSDNSSRYRDRSEELAWQARDPLARVRTYLESVGVDGAVFDRIDGDADSFAEAFRPDVRALADISMREVFTNAYGTMPGDLVGQLEEAEELIDREPY
jgi:2-oxoisovalerate dehydrogenase E1 component alpha subunit